MHSFCYQAFYFCVTLSLLSLAQSLDSSKPYIRSNENYCGTINVSDVPYKMYSQEPNSEGLSTIQNTYAVIEEFKSVEIREGCEATICKLHLTGDPMKRRVKAKCTQFSTNSTLVHLANEDPDPITKQYVVATGCSCQRCPHNCTEQTCETEKERIDLEIPNTTDNAVCAWLYKEKNCSECRYPAKILNKTHDRFCPTNTFWTQSYVIRDGCRLKLHSISSSGKYELIKTYEGVASEFEMDYVRAPNPSEISCHCGEEDDFVPPSGYIVMFLSIAASIILSGILSIVFWKYRFTFQIKKKNLENEEQEKMEMKKVCNSFKYGVVNKGFEPITDEDGKSYVSFSFLAALREPYKHKWEISRNRIEILDQPLGKGQFGKVCLGKLKMGNGSYCDVAVKMAKVSYNLNCFQSILDEIKMLSFIGIHPHICCLHGAYTKNIKKREALIVLELCSEGNLKDYLKRNKKSFLESVPDQTPVVYDGYTSFPQLDQELSEDNLKILPEKLQMLLKWSAEIASGMEYLSRKQVIHIDLAARNILLTDKLSCKVADFGLSQRLDDVRDYVRIAKEYPLPFRWMALESLKYEKFTVESDVWSYGVILFEMFSLGKDPFPSMNDIGTLVDLLSEGRRLEKPDHCTDEIYEIMLDCWDENEDLRPRFKALRKLFGL